MGGPWFGLYLIENGESVKITIERSGHIDI
jgi:hypothetical protein